jgi:hypothetical protein
MAGDVNAGDPHLVAIDPVPRNPAAHFGHRNSVHMRRVTPVMFFGQAKAPAHFSFKHRRDEVRLLLRRSKITQHKHLYEIANDAAFILEIIVEPQAAVRKVMPDRRHR